MLSLSHDYEKVGYNFQMGRLIIHKKIILLFLLIFSLLSFGSYFVVNSETDCESNNLSGGQIDECVAKLKRDAEALVPAHENNKKELDSLNSQVKSLTGRIANLTKQLKNLDTNIKKREEDLGFTKKVFSQKAYEHYKRLRVYDTLNVFLENESYGGVFRELAFRQRTIDGDRLTMEKYATELANLKNDKDSLSKNKESLSQIQVQVDKRAKFLAEEVNKVENYLSELSSRQEELLALKAGGFSTSIGDTPETLEPCTGPSGSSNFCDPGFRPAFAAFSFGAPHRTGMSQYGAYGRSKSGQSAETILSAYYQGATLVKDYQTPSTIEVIGVGRISFEDRYMLGIYEVPESWGEKGGFEALKAQAVAARSYALYYTGNASRSICATESCQVFKNSPKTGKWAEAVRATKGWVLTKNGQAAPTYFASTSGGYTISQWGWSGIKDAQGDWPQTAFEKVAGSPWFYKAWFKSRSGASCGRSNPWLSSERMADILNAWRVLFEGVGSKDRISPEIDSCWKSGNPYSVSDLKSVGGFTEVNSVSVIYSNQGSTQSLNFSTNKGGVTISAEEFRKAFNLRAPGNIGVKSSLFNIEKL